MDTCWVDTVGWVWKTVKQSAPHKDSRVAKKDGEGVILRWTQQNKRNRGKEGEKRRGRGGLHAKLSWPFGREKSIMLSGRTKVWVIAGWPRRLR